MGNNYYDTIQDPIGSVSRSVQHMEPIKSAKLPDRALRKSRVYGMGARKCHSCDKVLSKYNPGPYCYNHTKTTYPRIRGRV